MLLGKETLRNKRQKGYKGDRRNTWNWNKNQKWQWQWQVGIHSWSLWVLGWKLARKHRSRMHLCTSFQESLTLTLCTFTSVKFLSDLSCAKSTGVWQGRISSSRVASWMFHSREGFSVTMSVVYNRSRVQQSRALGILSSSFLPNKERPSVVCASL